MGPFDTKSKVCIDLSLIFLLIEFGPVTLIDTPGFGALEWEFEREIVEQLVEVLKNQGGFQILLQGSLKVT